MSSILISDGRNGYLTVTLNPALDRTMIFDHFEAGRLNRAVLPSLTAAGGKGINVSRMLLARGTHAPALYFSGGVTGRMLNDLLAEEGIESYPVFTGAETRINSKMLADGGALCTEANEAGGPVTEEEFQKFSSELSTIVEKLFTQFEKLRVFLCGSIPQGVDKTVYKKLMPLLKEQGASCILDCDGEALAEGIKAGPVLIKPNLDELSRFCGQVIHSVEKAVDNSRRIYHTYGCAVLCTMGSDGAVYVGKEGCYRVISPQVVPKSFSGAGDCFLASFVSEWDATGIVEKSLRFAALAAAEKVCTDGSVMPRSIPERDVRVMRLSSV